MSHGQPHVKGRGCPCTKCENRRAASKAYYHRKKNGETPRGRSEPELMPLPRNDPRFVQTKTPDMITIHYMPKEEEWWVCPECGAEFVKKDSVWSLERYT